MFFPIYDPHDYVNVDHNPTLKILSAKLSSPGNERGHFGNPKALLRGTLPGKCHF
jgi:hypothetical protein